jgi:hypothetical protein
VDDAGAKTWILIGSLDNFRATREHGFRLIGMQQLRRRMAETVILVEDALRDASRHESAA